MMEQQRTGRKFSPETWSRALRMVLGRRAVICPERIVPARVGESLRSLITPRSCSAYTSVLEFRLGAHAHALLAATNSGSRHFVLLITSSDGRHSISEIDRRPMENIL